MTVTVKLAVLAVVLLAEIAMLGLLGRRLRGENRSAVLMALVSSSMVTIGIVGYVLFAVVD